MSRTEVSSRLRAARFRRQAWQALVLCWIVLLGGCLDIGGDNSTPPIVANVQSVSVTSLTDGVPHLVQVEVTFRGVDARVADTPGIPAAPWLVVYEDRPLDIHRERFTFTINPAGLAPGVHRTTARIAVGVPARGAVSEGTLDYSQYVDIPVTLTVIDLALDTQSVRLDEIRGDDVYTDNFLVSGAADADWQMSVDRSWLVLDTSSGTGPASVGYTIDTTRLATGNHLATVRMVHVDTGARLEIGVSVNVRSPDFIVPAAPLSLAVGHTTVAADLTLPLTLSDDLGGRSTTEAVIWELAGTDVPWLTLQPTSGTTASGSPVTVVLDAAMVRTLANGTHVGNLSLGYARSDGNGGTKTVPVSLTMAIPRIDAVAPYAVSSLQSHEVVIQGSGFQSPGNWQVLFGGQAAGGQATVVNDKQLRIAYPSLAAGEYSVQVPNALGVQSGARLLVLDDQALPGGTFPVSGEIKRVLYDDERQVLYGVDPTNHRLKRFARDGNTWTALSTISVTGGLVDAAMSPDGRTLVMITADGRVYELDLSTPGSVPRQTRQPGTDNWSAADIVFTNHRDAVIGSGYFGNDDFAFVRYNSENESASSLSDAAWPRGGSAFASGDGATVLLTARSSSSDHTVFFDTATGLAQRAGREMDVPHLSMSRDGARMLADDGSLYDRGLNLIGEIDLAIPLLFWMSPRWFLLSPDGTRAYVYRVDTSTLDPRQIDVYELASIPGDPATLINSFPLSPTIRTPGKFDCALATSRDGRTLFVWATAALVVIPLP